MLELVVFLVVGVQIILRFVDFGYYILVAGGCSCGEVNNS